MNLKKELNDGTIEMMGGGKMENGIVGVNDPIDTARMHEHYSDREFIISAMEQINERETIPPSARLDIALALKHHLRAGTKKSEPWEKEIRKTINYLERSLSGKWS